MSNWQYININNKLFIVKYIKSWGNSVECLFSDFQYIWKESVILENVLARAKEKNPNIEYDSEILMKIIVEPAELYQLNDNSILQKSATLHTKHYIFETPFCFYWNLMQCEQEEFLKHITAPLALSLKYFQIQNGKLREIIKQKDLEIDQYKMDGAKITRNTLQTIPFDDQSFDAKYQNQKEKEIVEILDLMCSSANMEKMHQLCNRNSIISNNISFHSQQQQQKTPEKTDIKNHSATPNKDKDNKKAIKKLKKKKLQRTEAKFFYERDSNSDSSTDSNYDKNFKTNETNLNSIKSCNDIVDTSLPKKPKIRKLNL